VNERNKFTKYSFSRLFPLFFLLLTVIYFSLAAKNRTSSSPSFLQQQSKISSVSSSSGFKREASPTVCCYSLSNHHNNNKNNNNFSAYNRSQLIRKKPNESERKSLKKENCENARYIKTQSNIPVPFDESRKFVQTSREIISRVAGDGGSSSNLKDKFKKIETSPYNNLKNRSTTTTVAATTTSSVATFRTQSADARESVGENRRIYDDDKNSNFSTSLINCDERQRLKVNAVQKNNNNNNTINNNNNKGCKFKIVSDNNNNHTYENITQSKITNILNDNDFSYIDSSSISRSSSASFKSDEISVNEKDDKVKSLNNNTNSLQNYQIPKKITRISCDSFNDAERIEIAAASEQLSTLVTQSSSVENLVSQ
jgi:hypothetical protein